MAILPAKPVAPTSTCCRERCTTPAGRWRNPGQPGAIRLAQPGAGDQTPVADHAHHQAQAQAALARIDARQAELQADAERAIARPTTRIHPPERSGRIRRRAPAPWLQLCRWSSSAFVPSWPTTWACGNRRPFAAELVEVRKSRTGVARRHRARAGQPPRCAFWCPGGNAAPPVGEPAAQPAACAPARQWAAMPRLQPFLPTVLCASSTSNPQLHGPPEHAAPTAARPGPPLRAPEVPETLERTPHAMTAQGLMSSQSGYFDKQDQKALDQDWMTGLTTVTGWCIYNKGAAGA